MNSTLNVTAILSEEVAAVEITGVGIDGWLDRDRKATGWSKKHPQDVDNPEVAYNLAMARALQDLSNQYARNAANLAGFPVQIDLDAEGPDKGTHAALLHHPEDQVVEYDTEEDWF